jgi:hypothetical protein
MGRSVGITVEKRRVVDTAESATPSAGAYCGEFRAAYTELENTRELTGLTADQRVQVAIAIMGQRATDRRQMMIERRGKR